MTWVLIGGFVIGSAGIAWSIDWHGLGQLLQGETRTPEEALNETRSVNEKFARRRLTRPPGSAVGSGPEAAVVTASIATSHGQDEVGVLAGGGRSAESDAQTPRPGRRPGGARVSPEVEREVEPEVEIEQYEASPTDKSGIVSINCYVPARVYIDGQYSGVTPRTVHLLAGEHQVRLVAEGYLEWSNRIQVRSRHQMGVLASMTREE